MLQVQQPGVRRALGVGLQERRFIPGLQCRGQRRLDLLIQLLLQLQHQVFRQVQALPGAHPAQMLEAPVQDRVGLCRAFDAMAQQGQFELVGAVLFLGLLITLVELLDVQLLEQDGHPLHGR